MKDYSVRNNADLHTRSQAESVVKRLYEAVEILCTGKGDVRDRLKDAIIVLIVLQEIDFHNYLQNDYKWIIEQSTKYKSQIPKYRGNIDATMRRIKNETGRKIARRIIKLYSEIQDIRGFPILDYRNPKE